jgi:hypothetical protein
MSNKGWRRGIQRDKKTTLKNENHLRESHYQCTVQLGQATLQSAAYNQQTDGE